MPLKTKKSKNPQNFPFTEAQLAFFDAELKHAGGFHKLMFQKKALDERLGMKYITIYRNIERYRMKYLVGLYELLRSFYDTEMPFVFWSELYEVLLASKFQE